MQQLILFAGNIWVLCRGRPLFEDEGASIVEFPRIFLLCFLFFSYLFVQWFNEL